MTHVVPIDDALAALNAPQWAIVREAVERITVLLKNGLDQHLVEQLSQKLEELAGHSKWEVRRAVARALEHVRSVRHEVALAKLLEDDHADVQSAASHTLMRWAEVARGELRRDEEDVLEQWLRTIEKRHGRPAMQLAKDVATRYAELFVGQALHEIVKVIAPLNTSLLNLQTDLRREEIDRRKCAKSARSARDRVALLDSMTESLRNFMADVTPEFVRVKLRKVVTDADSLVRQPFAGSGTSLDIAIERGAEIDADPRLVFAFSNIIKNAYESFKVKKRKNRIRVEAQLHDGNAVITFADTGCGMEEDDVRVAARLFSTSKGLGRGFGLPFAKRVIEREHKGKLGMTSKSGEGTIVTVRLPIEQEES